MESEFISFGFKPFIATYRSDASRILWKEWLGFEATTEKETEGETSIDMLIEIAEQILSKY